MDEKEKHRFKCANCGFVFDKIGYAECVKCGSNACDEVKRFGEIKSVRLSISPWFII